MTYLDYDRLEAIDARSFRDRKPFPWINPHGLLTEEGHARLVETLPEVDGFARLFGIERSHGQAPHDRFALEYDEDLDVATPWHDFVRELRGARYGRFLRGLFGPRLIRLGFHWHYTPDGCSVSPHCDAKRKLGSHIFYFNTSADWQPGWGGETLILDDGGRFPRRSAPRFEDFDTVITSQALDNHSLLFARGRKSWHGVREVRCPEGAYRKVFIVVINDWPLSVGRAILAPLRGKSGVGY